MATRLRGGAQDKSLPRYRTVTSLARHVGVSTMTMIRYERAGLLEPAAYLEKSPLYDDSVIDALLESDDPKAAQARQTIRAALERKKKTKESAG